MVHSRNTFLRVISISLPVRTKRTQGAKSEEDCNGKQIGSNSVMMNKKQEKPHAVCIPFPAQGHINPMLMMAKLLHHEGFHITFVNTVYNHNRLLKSNGASFIESLPDFNFEKIDDGLDGTADTDRTQDVIPLCKSITENFTIPFRKLLLELNDISFKSGGVVPPVTCIVSDLSMPFTSSVAEELGIPIALLLTPGACGFASVAYYHDLVTKGFFPVKDESYLANGYLEKTIDFIPGMGGIRLKDLYTFFRTGKQDDVLVKFNLEKIRNASKASAIVGNTFDALEHDIIEGLPSLKILPIGPLHLFLNRIERDSPLHLLSSNLWKNEHECMSWLSLREPKSVLYLNLGSIAVMTPQQSIEFAWGLANSKKTFLWILRPDMVANKEFFLPPEFVEETRGRGLLTGWCQQEQVLNHPSVGGFLTHCGWNSTLESICAGVPMICWPYFADQQTNCWFSCNKVGTGMELNNEVNRNEVEKLVRELMEGNKGKDMYQKATDWKRLAYEAISPHGSSSTNFEKLVKEVLVPKSHKTCASK